MSLAYVETIKIQAAYFENLFRKNKNSFKVTVMGGLSRAFFKMLKEHFQLICSNFECKI